MSKELIDKVKKNLEKGYSPETLKYAFIKQGYPRITVERALDKAQKDIAKDTSTKPQAREKPKIRHEIYDQNDNIVKVYDTSEKKSFWKKVSNYLKDFLKKQ